MPEESTIPQMRERIDELNNAVKAKEDEINSLRGEVRKFSARDAFREAGYAPQHGDLYAAQAGEKLDLDPGKITEFADQFNLTPVAASTPDPEPDLVDEGAGGDADPDAGLANFASGGSGAGEGGQPSASQKMSKDDWRALQKTDPVAAGQALRQGRVDLREDNFWLNEGARVGR